MQQKKLILTSNKVFFFVRKNFFIFFLALFSILVTFYYGYLGIFPLDSFLIYDAGYKLLNGFHPFKDYWSITGPFLDYLQFLIFKIFGVSWFNYVLHSALMNLTLTVIFFNFLIILGLKKFNSFIYSLSISILAYPSIGTPFMDHHAVILSLISLMLIILASKTNKSIYWFLTPIFLFLSFLSKQIPSAYLLIIFLIYIFFYRLILKPSDLKFSNNLFLGSLSAILGFIIILLINDISFKNFFEQYFFYPIEIGSNRVSGELFNFKKIILDFKLLYLSIIPLGLVLFKLITEIKKKDIKKDILIIILIILSILIFIYSQILTKNQILIFFLIPFCLGVSNLFVDKYFKNKILLTAIIFLLIFATFKYHLRFNEDKKFMELEKIDLSKSIDAEKFDKSLKGLKWISPEYPNNPAGEIKFLNLVKEKIGLDRTNKIIISDYQILPSVLGLKTFSPNKWFDTLSVPSKENKFFENYKNFFLNGLLKQNIETIYIIGDKKIFLENIFKNNCYDEIIFEKRFQKILINKCFN